jgi:hypothetical protein
MLRTLFTIIAMMFGCVSLACESWPTWLTPGLCSAAVEFARSEVDRCDNVKPENIRTCRIGANSAIDIVKEQCNRIPDDLATTQAQWKSEENVIAPR